MTDTVKYQTDEYRAQRASYITWVGFGVNVGLTVVKFVAGILGRSSAMVADAVHSLSDFITDIIVIVSFSLIKKPADDCHHYGHGRFETLATVLIGVALVIVAFGIGYNSVEAIIRVAYGEKLNQPGLLALFAALLSLLSKEWLFRYTRKIGREINSAAVDANAWHHRSDAFSSIGTAVGIGGAIFLGEKFRVLDPVAALAVSIFILKVAFNISWGAMSELMDKSLDDDTNEDLMNIIGGTKGVLDPHNLRTRKIGNNISVDVHIRVNRNLSIVDTHEITLDIENRIRQKYGEKTYISVHSEPEKLENAK